jgi:hypothetical protein
MALYRYVQTTFWTDPFVENLTKEEKLLYIYLLTNARTKQCGVYEISIKAIAFELDYTKNQHEIIRTLISKLSSANKIKYNEEANELLIVNWLKHNNYQNPKVKSCIIKELKEVKTKQFIEYVLNIIENNTNIGDIDMEYIDNEYPIDTLSIGYTYDIDTSTQIKRKRKTIIKTKEKEKSMFGEHKNVLLTEEEYQKMLSKPNGLKAIEKLSNYKQANGKEYKSDYGAINTWVLSSLENEKKNPYQKEASVPEWYDKYAEKQKNKPKIKVEAKSKEELEKEMENWK